MAVSARDQIDWGRRLTTDITQLPDAWRRRANAPRVRRAFRLFGRPFEVEAPDAGLLASFDAIAPLYSRAAPVDDTPLQVQIVVTTAVCGPPPGDLLAHCQYSAGDDWQLIQASDWGQVFVDLARGKAVVALAPALSTRPDIVGHAFLNTLCTNWLFRRGFAMLHCTGVERDGRVVLLLAPHNAGKSTAALRLVLAGFRLVSDSQIYVSPEPARLTLLGFPLGRTRLRPDMIEHFPEVRPYLKERQIRGEQKFVLDVRAWRADRVYETAVAPSAVHLCLLSRSDDRDTTFHAASATAVADAIMANSWFYDALPVWRRHLQQIDRLVEMASWHHLVVGRDGERLVHAVDALLSP